MKSNFILHQTHQTLAGFDEIAAYFKENFKEPGLHLFPELYLSGYPLQDLVLSKPFIVSYEAHQQGIHEWLLTQPQDDAVRGLLGGLRYVREDVGLPDTIENVIYEAIPGQGLKAIYTKRLLPNYDIFDEQKYFSPGRGNTFYKYQEEIFGLLICEDMWASSFHELDPCHTMKAETEEKKINLDAIINLSASPFATGKVHKRYSRAKEIAHLFGCPFIYVNRVGGEDEILFDGTSFVHDGEKALVTLSSFSSEKKLVDIKENFKNSGEEIPSSFGNTWEGQFAPQLDLKRSPAALIPLDDKTCEEVSSALCFGLQEYASKSGFKKFLVALSGGIDSALVLALTHLSLKEGQSVEAIYMPSMHSSSLSTQLCDEMCKTLKIPLSYLPIKFLHSAVKNAFGQTFREPFEGLTDENVQSRLRGTLLYTRSNQTGAMVINTSNKSELAVGYSTQYGDSVGAISLLGDLYKTEVFALSEYLVRKHPGLIPRGIIDRGPSAELRPDQLDQDSLPPYGRLDAVLECILSYHYSKKEILNMGFTEEEVSKIMRLYAKSEYKRAQFCPIIKVKSKSFGFGYRMPMSKDFQYLD